MGGGQKRGQTMPILLFNFTFLLYVLNFVVVAKIQKEDCLIFFSATLITQTSVRKTINESSNLRDTEMFKYSENTPEPVLVCFFDSSGDNIIPKLAIHYFPDGVLLLKILPEISL